MIDRTGWVAALIAALACCFLVIGIAVRCQLDRKRKAQKKRRRTILTSELDGGKNQPEEQNNQKTQAKLQTKATDHPKTNWPRTLSEESPESKEGSSNEVLTLEGGSQTNPEKLKGEEDTHSRKSSLMTRFSLRSFALKPAVDMSVFQVRNDPPIDTFQLEIKHRERLSKLT